MSTSVGSLMSFDPSTVVEQETECGPQYMDDYYYRFTDN